MHKIKQAYFSLSYNENQLADSYLSIIRVTMYIITMIQT